MRPALLRRILLTQAIEKADANGEVLPADVREQATREAARSASLRRDSDDGEQARFFAARADSLVAHLLAHFPAFATATRSPRRLRWLVPALLIAAFIFGWATQALGAEKLVNILSFPLLGILGWNALVYLGEAIHLFLPGRRHEKDTPESAGFLNRLAEAADELPKLPGRDSDSSSTEIPPALRCGLADFQKIWHRLRAPLITLRLRAALHLAAALLATAAVAGMYAKGTSNEYRAYWESTFFTTQTVQALLDTVLGPAATVSGLAVPDVGPLHREAGNTAFAGGNAAPWIHLYALTMGLLVTGPRLVLAIVLSLRARRIERGIDPRAIRGGGLYCDRLLAEALGTALAAEVTPYCHRPSPTAEAALRRDLERDLGVPVKLRWRETVRLGEEAEAAHQLVAAAAEDPPAAHLVLCFDFAAIPEDEAHGEFMRAVRLALDEAGAETRLHFCLDAEGFDDSRGSLPDFAGRRAERLAAWRESAGPQRDAVLVVPDLSDH